MNPLKLQIPSHFEAVLYLNTMVLFHRLSSGETGMGPNKKKRKRTEAEQFLNVGKTETCGTRLGLGFQCVTLLWKRVARGMSFQTTSALIDCYMIRDPVTGVLRVARMYKVDDERAKVVEGKIRERRVAFSLCCKE